MQVYEAVFSRQPNFLGEPAWQPALLSLARPDSSEEDQKYFVLGHFGVRASRLLEGVYSCVCVKTTASDDEIDALVSQCRIFKEDISEWRRHSNSYMTATTAHERVPASQGDVRAEFFSVSFVIYAITCRLVGALSHTDRVAEEREAISISNYLNKLRCSANWDSIADFYFCRRTVFTDAILATTSVWLEGCEEADGTKPEPRNGISGRSRLIEAYKFELWRNSWRVSSGADE